MQVEDVHRSPFTGYVGAQGKTVDVQVDAIRFVRGELFGAGIEQQWRGRHHAAEADVGDVAYVIDDDQAQAMGPGRPGALRLPHHHPTADGAGVETQFLKQGQKQLVEFVAITATARMQDLALDGRQVDQHRFAG
ncbi:hypothetical protein D3C80_1030990 [compost metagenome]